MTLPMLDLVDTHCHLAFEAFDADRDEVISRARRAGLSACLCVAVDGPSAVRARKLADQHAGWAHATSGLHPTETACASEEAWTVVEAQLRGGRFAAVGETGLDAFHDEVPLDAQRLSLERHLALALELDLPVVLHCRDAFPELLEQVEPWAARGVRGVLHCFTGGPGDVERLLAARLHVGVGGIATFKPRDDLRGAVRAIPTEQLLIETDAPWLAPTPHRGRRNEPAFVRHVVECLAKDRGVDVEEFAAATTRAAVELFALDRPR